MRFTMKEIEDLKEVGYVTEKCVIGYNNTFIYSLILSENLTEIKVDSSEGRITAYLPTTLAQQWLKTEQVGIEATIENGMDNKLQVLLEKDWQCMQPRSHEDESDLFPHPKS